MQFRTGIVLAAGGLCFVAANVEAGANPLARQQQNDPHRMMAAAQPLFGWPALVKEARKYIGTNPTARDRLWCATFMNMILHRTGYAGTNSDAARSFAQYGQRISHPEVGAIAVLTRGKRGGHVGVVTGIDPHGNPVVISGNHNKRVGVAVYARSRVIAYVRPVEHGSVPAQVAARAAAGAPDGSLESPIAELLAAINAEEDAPQARAAMRQDPAPQARQPLLAVPPAALAPRAVQPASGQGSATPWGELFDAMEKAQSARDRRAEQVTPGRVVR